MNARELRDHAAKIGVPLRSLEQVKQTLVEAEQSGGESGRTAMHRLLRRYGRVTPDALAWLESHK
jgi:hypothetical protein